jgi:transposase InsO family protein
VLEISETQILPTDENKLKWIQKCHDSPVAEHPGRAKTYDQHSHSHSCNQMRENVDRYVRNCHSCQRSKATHRKTHGLSRPLQVLEHPWKDLSMDFVVGPPESKDFNAVWVVVNRPTKMRHLVPCTDNADGKKLGEIYVKEVFRLHGLPETIVSDQEPQFASEFWTHICERLGIKRRLSTAFHPQNNGQTERISM